LWIHPADRDQHHGALLDAELTAEAFIKMATGGPPVERNDSVSVSSPHKAAKHPECLTISTKGEGNSVFSIGQTVYHRTGRHSGKVLECDGGTVYLVRANGVEIEFPGSELTAAPSPEKNPAATGATALSRALTVGEITPEHRRVLAIVPQRTIQSVAALFERRPKSGRFSALDVANKLNLQRTAGRVLGLMMGRGLSVSYGTVKWFGSLCRWPVSPAAGCVTLIRYDLRFIAGST
jgi:hypothetical protein